MNRRLKIALLWAAAVATPWAVAAPGEYWEMTNKSEMKGMPGMPAGGMPSHTSKVCVPKGSERDPKSSMTDKDCVMSDMKSVGNKMMWKMTCNNKGEVMTGEGEMTTTPDSQEGTTRMQGSSGGRKFDMTMSYKNRRIGGACDTEDALKEVRSKMDAQKAVLCDTTGKTTEQMLNQATYLLDQEVCPGKKQPFCEMLRREIGRDSTVFAFVSRMDKNYQGKDRAKSPSNSCGIDMETTASAICKTFSSKNAESLTAHCPVEAKAYRDNERRKSCEGRSYTAREDLSKCLAGIEPNEVNDEELSASPAKRNSRTKAIAGPSATNTVTLPRDEVADMPPSQRVNPGKNNDANGNPADALMESAKKLKGLFKF
jgi:hypothetical protein